MDKSMVTDSTTENIPPEKVRVKWWGKSPPRLWQQRRQGKPRAMQDKQGEGRLPAESPPGISRTLFIQSALVYGREKNGHPAHIGWTESGLQNPSGKSLHTLPHAAQFCGPICQQGEYVSPIW